MAERGVQHASCVSSTDHAGMPSLHGRRAAHHVTVQHSTVQRVFYVNIADHVGMAQAAETHNDQVPWLGGGSGTLAQVLTRQAEGAMHRSGLYCSRALQ